MNERIFVIEDDENIQEIVKLSLESNGYQVTLFDNAIDAIIEIKRDAPDLAIFDVMLPQMDGISAVKKIRETNTEIPILILSAKDSEIDKIHGLGKPATWIAEHLDPFITAYIKVTTYIMIHTPYKYL